jgi:DNA-binding NtrC family response regulator
MARLIVKDPNDQAEQTIVLGESEAVLLGRAPDLRGVRLEPEEGERSLRAVPVAAPSVSANHALAWSQEGAVHLRDLGSRNGSLISLPRNGVARISGGDVVLQLARTTDGSARRGEPPPPRWTSAAEFAPSLKASIEAWLRHEKMSVEVRIVSDPEGGPDLPGRVPLATGEALDLMPLHTVDALWSEQLEVLWRWVARQNLDFEAERDAESEGIILASPAIRRAHRDVVAAARAGSSTLLLTGPSGAGKERMAETFHLHSGRSGPFVAVNCSMLSKEMLRSELFGAEAGSFTGATRRIVGAVERAGGGTLFLDEIGDLAPEVQPMLLRFLDRREYDRLGQSGRVQRADVRVVAATNRDLREAARSTGFRADLWYRLSVRVVDVPPLAARWEDIAAYLARARVDGAGSLADALSPEALELLRAHPWDGNFRELTNFADRFQHGPTPIDAAACREALAQGALHAPSLDPPASPVTDEDAAAKWHELARRAAEAFMEDSASAGPESWDQVKDFGENYLKPLLFAHLSGAVATARFDQVDVGRAAKRLGADRGTAQKQLMRYFTRFG